MFIFWSCNMMYSMLFNLYCNGVFQSIVGWAKCLAWHRNKKLTNLLLVSGPTLSLKSTGSSFLSPGTFRDTRPLYRTRMVVTVPPLQKVPMAAGPVRRYVTSMYVCSSGQVSSLGICRIPVSGKSSWKARVETTFRSQVKVRLKSGNSEDSACTMSPEQEISVQSGVYIVRRTKKRDDFQRVLCWQRFK